MADQPQPAVYKSKKKQKEAEVKARKIEIDKYMAETNPLLDKANSIEDIAKITVHNINILGTDYLVQGARRIEENKDKEKLMKLISEFAEDIMIKLKRPDKKITVKVPKLDENGDQEIDKDTYKPLFDKVTKVSYDTKYRREAMKIAFKVFKLYSDNVLRNKIEKIITDKGDPVQYILNLKQKAKDEANAKTKARREFISALTGGKMKKEDLDKLPEDLRTFFLENRNDLKNYKRNMRLAKIAKINDLNVNIYDYPKYLVEQKKVKPSDQFTNQLTNVQKLIEKNKIKIRIPYQKIPKRMRPTIDYPYYVLREGETLEGLEPDERAKRLRPVVDEETLAEIKKVREAAKLPTEYKREELEKYKIPYETAIFHEKPVGEPYHSIFEKRREEEARLKKVPYPYPEMYK